MHDHNIRQEIKNTLEGGRKSVQELELEIADLEEERLTLNFKINDRKWELKELKGGKK